MTYIVSARRLKVLSHIRGTSGATPTGPNRGCQPLAEGLRIDLLGETRLTRDGRSIPTGGPRRGAIIALLALRAPRSVSRSELGAALWGNQPPASAVNAVHVHISALRRTMGHDAILTAGEGYRLGGDVTVDVAEFHAAAARGIEQLAQGQAAEAAQTLRGALGLWRGPALADLDDSTFSATEAARLAKSRLDVIADRIKADLLLGRHREVIGELELLVAEHPLRESLRALLMQALYRADRQAEALAVYEEGRRILRDDLGLDPSPALRELHHNLLTQRDPLPTAAVPPMPRSLSLPVLLDETVGRDLELAALTSLLVDGQVRLVTVLGTGGVGKTRLAVAAGERLGELVADGVAFVSLAEAATPDDVALTICSALRVSAENDPIVTLERVLYSRQMVLICDNFEHVLDAASLLPRLLAAAAGLRILVTSRQPLGLRGERRFMVHPLAVESSGAQSSPAAQLFLARAATANPAFIPTPADLLDIAEIARRCDGLPLALELAAARARALPVGQLRRHLDAPLTLLVSDMRDIPERHRTLRANIAWSVGALEGQYARLLARLTVFRGGFTLTGAADVGGLHADTALGSIEVLLDHGLVSRTEGVSGAPRFDLLETIREYAAELLDPDERNEAHRRHAEHYRAWMEPVAEPGKSAAEVSVWVAQLAERANLRLAIRWALGAADNGLLADLIVSAAPIWDQTGPRLELLVWLARLLERDDVDPGRRCDAYWWSAALIADSDPPLMSAPLTDARELAERVSDTRRLAWVRLLCAVAEIYRERPAQAAEELSASAGLAEQHPEAVNLHISILMAMGHLSTVQGDDLALAAEHTHKALDLARRHRRDLRTMTLLNNVSEIMLVRDEPEQARRFAEEGLALAHLAQSLEGIAANQSQRGYASLLSGDVSAALIDLREALRGHLQLGTTYYALHDTVRLAAALSHCHPEVAALVLGVVEASPTFADQATSRQAKERFLADLEARLGARYTAQVARGRSLVTQSRERGALASVLAMTAALVG